MKRSSIVALVIGVLVGAIVITLHVLRVLAPAEEAIARFLSAASLERSVAGPLQFPLIVLLSLGVAWWICKSSKRKRLGWLLLLFAVEVAAIAGVCLLYQTFFQPLPSLLAIGLSAAASSGFVSVTGRSRSSMARQFFRDRISRDQVLRLHSGELEFVAEAKSYPVTAVVCDIANKHDLAEELPPAVLTELCEKFIAHVSKSFMDAGAYLESISGEGLVAIFGFPGSEGDQAEKAVRHALELVQSFEQTRAGSKDENFQKLGLHLGLSSGTMIVAPMQQDGSAALFSTGEPVELARRFCIANRFYGSRILVGPQTFEASSKAIVARPIDFLSGVDVRERHEIYEPLKLTGDASNEEIARRDSFWNGVVFYREKRWAEAYSQFQKARGPEDQNDAPLQLYLRRIEPLALRLTEEEP